MKDYLSLWRLLPRVSIGLVFFIVLVIAVGGLQGAIIVAESIHQFYDGFQSELVALAITILLLTVISTIGYQLSRIMALVFCGSARKVISLLFKKNSDHPTLTDFSRTIPDIVRSIYQNNREFFIKHYALKSAGGEKLDQMDAITSHFERVRQHLDGIRDWEAVCVQAYQECLSQDQRKIENMEEELSADISFCTILIVSSPVIFIRLWSVGHGPAIAISLILLVLGIAGLHAYASRKKYLARLQLSSYLDVFTVAEMSEYTEREGEPKL